MRIHEDPGPEPRRLPLRRADDQASAGLAAAAGGPAQAVTPGAVLGLQRTAGNAAVSDLLAGEDEQESPVKDVVGSGGGQPLDADTRGFMESRLGQDFGDVRVHSDGKASESAKAVQAHAYTVGNDVVFQRDQYDPHSDGGRRMLAHELTHVVQQRSGPVDGTPAPGGIKVSDPSDAYEQAAERSADQVVAGGPVDVAGSGTTGVQRQEETLPEEEELQGFWVQRQEEEEEIPEEAPGG